MQSLCKCIVPLSSHRANEWVLWNYPFDHHYYCPPKPPRGFRPSSPPPPAPPSASPAVLHPLAQPAVLPTTPLLTMMQESFKQTASDSQAARYIKHSQAAAANVAETGACSISRDCFCHCKRSSCSESLRRRRRHRRRLFSACKKAQHVCCASHLPASHILCGRKVS